MEKSVFQIKLPLPEEPGSHLLIIRSASGPFGGGGSSTFWVDAVVYDEKIRLYCAVLDRESVVTFPPETTFLVVNRNRIAQLSQEDVFRHNAEEDRELLALKQELYPDSPEESGPRMPESEPFVPVSSPLPGQYL